MIDEATRNAIDRAMDAAHDPKPASALRALDVHDLARIPFKPRAEMLAPWLHSQDLCMVYAARGIGKTHFALSVAYAVATGGSFGPWQAPQPRKVLYLDGELPGSVMQQRCLMHCPDAEPLPGYLRVLTPDIVPEDETLPDISTPEGQAAIELSIDPDTELIVVDNLSAWARTGRENDAESWHPIATWLLSLRRRGIAVLLVHHGGKNGQQRGTSKKEDLLDVVISLSRPKDYDPQQGAVFVLEFTKARNLTGTEAESLEFTLGGDENRALWSYSSAEASTVSAASPPS
ncbi:MAG TPA: AAA family ATPase [Roseateles sp.]|uniref:AAA family ATPase n=1 Tax=Roseateles sp. TaxID=1971397 RepID=UPI002ED986EF